MNKKIAKIMIDNWIKKERVYIMWQELSREDLKVLGIANLKERVAGKYFYNKDLFIKQFRYDEYKIRPRVLDWIFQNCPLTEEEYMYTQNLRWLHKKIEAGSNNRT